MENSSRKIVSRLIGQKVLEREIYFCRIPINGLGAASCSIQPFPGWNFRKYKGKLLAKPSRKSIDNVTQKISDMIKKGKAWKQEGMNGNLHAPFLESWKTVTLLDPASSSLPYPPAYQ
ncbi:MAG: hypothetical protein IBX40_09045 [Methanosarcinales archaeon]|nr:hypothetical protein [Methanosarcinales archaeon]